MARVRAREVSMFKSRSMARVIAGAMARNREVARVRGRAMAREHCNLVMIMSSR